MAFVEVSFPPAVGPVSAPVVPLFRKNQVQQLARAGDVAGLIALVEGGERVKERADAAHELARFSEEIESRHADAARTALTNAARDPDPEVRSAALFAWAELSWDDSLDQLLTATDDPEWMVRLFAVTMLGRFPRPRAVARLGQALADDSEPMVREGAASSLGQLADRGALGALRLAEESDLDREVRRAARDAVKQLEKGSA